METINDIIYSATLTAAGIVLIRPVSNPFTIIESVDSIGLSALAHGSTSDPDPTYINPVRTRIQVEAIAIHLIHIRRWIRSGFDPD